MQFPRFPRRMLARATGMLPAPPPGAPEHLVIDASRRFRAAPLYASPNATQDAWRSLLAVSYTHLTLPTSDLV